MNFVPPGHEAGPDGRTHRPGQPQLVLDNGENCGRSSAYIPLCPIIQTSQNVTADFLLLAALTRERRAVIVVVAMASVTVGAFTGWLLAMIMASAVMSYSQQRMQRKLRHWQAETARARAYAEAERLEREGLTKGGPPPSPGG